MKKVVSVVMSVAMMLSLMFGLTACSDPTEEVVGTWETTIDLFELSGPLFEEDDELAEYIQVGEFNVVMYFVFNEDGTYTFATDEEKLAESAATVKEEIISGMKAYFEDYIVAEELDCTVEELLEAAEVSLEDTAEEMLGDAVIQELVAELEMEGQYKVETGVIYMSESLDEEPDGEIGEIYEISGDEMTFSAPEDATEEEAVGYPMVFKKVK